MDQQTPHNTGESVTHFPNQWKEGDPDSADRVIGALHGELHRIAARMLHAERQQHTLQPTALISELYLRLNGEKPLDWHDRSHFLPVAANTLRRILIDHARAHAAQRRGGGVVMLSLDGVDAGGRCSYDDLLIIDQALTLLTEADPRAARVTELRFFGGLNDTEIALELDVSDTTVKRDWKFARAWLATHLGSG